MSATCTKCKKPIHWAILPNGNKVALDMEAKVLRYRHTPGEQGQATLVVEGEYLVSHFAVCPGAANKSPQPPASSRGDSEPNPEAPAFCVCLDQSGIELSPFEEDFVRSIVERSITPQGSARNHGATQFGKDRMSRPYRADQMGCFPSFACAFVTVISATARA